MDGSDLAALWVIGGMVFAGLIIWPAIALHLPVSPQVDDEGDPTPAVQPDTDLVSDVRSIMPSAIFAFVASPILLLNLAMMLPFWLLSRVFKLLSSK